MVLLRSACAPDGESSVFSHCTGNCEHCLLRCQCRCLTNLPKLAKLTIMDKQVRARSVAILDGDEQVVARRTGELDVVELVIVDAAGQARPVLVELQPADSSRRAA